MRRRLLSSVTIPVKTVPRTQWEAPLGLLQLVSIKCRDNPEEALEKLPKTPHKIFFSPLEGQGFPFEWQLCRLRRWLASIPETKYTLESNVSMNSKAIKSWNLLVPSILIVSSAIGCRLRTRMTELLPEQCANQCKPSQRKQPLIYCPNLIATKFHWRFVGDSKTIWLTNETLNAINHCIRSWSPKWGLN